MNPSAEDTTTTSTPGFSRRTLVKSAAWSLPVIAIAVAAPAASASGTTAAAKLSFDNFNFSNRGKQMNAEIQFDYVDWQFTLFISSITFTVLVPKSAYSGQYTITGGSKWSAKPAVASGSNWSVTFTYTGTLNQSQSTSQLVVTWITIPDTDTQGAPAGTIVAGTAFGALSDGTLTPVLARNADFW